MVERNLRMSILMVDLLGELPALRDGSTTAIGFQSVVEHLRSISNGQWDLDAHLTPMQKADCLA